MSYERDRREIIEEYFEKRKEDQIKEEVLRYCLDADALERIHFIRVSDVFLYDKLRDTIVNLYNMGKLTHHYINLPRLKNLVRQVKEFMKMEERRKWRRKIV